MIKRLLIFVSIVVLLFVLGFFINRSLIEKNGEVLQFSLLTVYLFLAISSLVIYILTELIIEYLPNETGYLYLALTMIKMGVFVLLFQQVIFSENPISKPEKLSMVIPFFLFLITEAVAVSNLLNNKDYISESQKNKKTLQK